MKNLTLNVLIISILTCWQSFAMERESFYSYIAFTTPWPEKEADKFEKIKSCIRKSHMKKDSYKIVNSEMRIYSKYSLLEWKAFLSNSEIWNNKEDFIYMAHNIKEKGMFENDLTATVDWTLAVIFGIEKNRDSLIINDLVVPFDQAGFEPVTINELYENGYQALIEDALRNKEGLVIGEADHKDFCAKYFLSRSMKYLKDQGVTHIFLEHFCEALQPEIDYYLNTGELTPALTSFLKYHDFHNYIGFYDILKSARDFQVSVIASETESSYLIATGLGGGDRVGAGTRAMYESIKKMPNKGKWVAFIGAAHNCGKKALQKLLGVDVINIAVPSKAKALSDFIRRDSADFWTVEPAAKPLAMPASVSKSASFDLSQSCLGDSDSFELPEAIKFDIPLSAILSLIFNETELARANHQERIDYIINYRGADSFDAAIFVDEFMEKCKRCFQQDELRTSMLDFVLKHYSIEDKRFVARE